MKPQDREPNRGVAFSGRVGSEGPDDPGKRELLKGAVKGAIAFGAGYAISKVTPPYLDTGPVVRTGPLINIALPTPGPTSPPDITHATPAPTETQKSEQYLERLEYYEDGDTIENDPFKPRVEGWSVKIDAARIQEVAQANPDRYFTFSFEKPTDTYGSFTVPNPGPFKTYDDVKLSSFPLGFTTILLLRYKVFDDSSGPIESGGPYKIVEYPIRLWNHAPPSLDRIYPLSSDTALDQDNFDKIDQLVSDFYGLGEQSGYVGPQLPAIIINKNVEGGVEDRVIGNGVIEVDTDSFVKPEYENQGEIETAYFLASYLASISKDRDHLFLDEGPAVSAALTDLLKSYWKARKTLDRVKKGTFYIEVPSLDESPVHSQFDFHEYIEGEGLKRPGWSLVDRYFKLFGSAVVSMRYFPDKFITRFQNLPEIDKEIARDFASSSLNFLEVAFPGKSEAILPESTRIKKALGINFISTEPSDPRS